jgi:hypothetical protein
MQIWLSGNAQWPAEPRYLTPKVGPGKLSLVPLDNKPADLGETNPESTKSNHLAVHTQCITGRVIADLGGAGVLGSHTHEEAVEDVPTGMCSSARSVWRERTSHAMHRDSSRSDSSVWI